MKQNMPSFNQQEFSSVPIRICAEIILQMNPKRNSKVILHASQEEPSVFRTREAGFLKSS